MCSRPTGHGTTTSIQNLSQLCLDGKIHDVQQGAAQLSGVAFLYWLSLSQHNTTNTLNQ